MTTYEHILATLAAMADKTVMFPLSDEAACEKILEKFLKEMPWLVLPDGIRAYIGARQAGHFENIEGRGQAYMVYPDESVLKELTKANAADEVEHYVPDGIISCVIGETTNLAEFERKNWKHRHFTALNIHMVQDAILDKVLREQIVDHSKRFEDKYTGRITGKSMDGKMLRAEITNFQNLSTLVLAGVVYKKLGILANREWMEANILPALMEVYPEELAIKTFSFMKVPDEIEERISLHQFGLTDADCDEKLIGIMDDLHAWIHMATMERM